MRNSALFLSLIVIVVPSLLFAQEPLEAVRQNIESGIRVLEDPQYGDDSRKQEQHKLLWELMQQTYDFKEFSRKVLGPQWYRFNRQQQEEFVKVFSRFLGKFYLVKLQVRYSGQRVNYLRQQMINDSKALVEIEVTWRNLKVPVELWLTNRSGGWKVYDLSVLGINAVSNYRAQFKSILKKESPPQVIARIKNKIEKLDEES